MTLLSVISIHEAGHIIAAALCGVRLSGVSAVGVGLQIKLFGSERISYPKELLIYAGGAAFNLAALLLPGMGEQFYRYSVGAAVFNLIPLRGSDGDGIITALLAMALKLPETIERIRIIVDEISLVVMWCAAIVLNLCGRGSLPLLVAVTLVFVRRMKRAANIGE